MQEPLALQTAYVAGWVLPLYNLVPDFVGSAFGGRTAAYVLTGSLVKSIPVAWLGFRALSGARSDFAQLIGAGLIFGSAGDLLLDLVSLWPTSFLIGLVAFLAGHVCYCAAFFQQPRRFPAVALPLLLAPIGLVYILWPHLPADMRIPVIAYASVIATMAVLAVSLRADAAAGVTTAAARNAALGALVFVVSDSILAIDRFRAALPLGKLLVMLTYYAAQLLTFASAQGVEAAIGARESDKKKESYLADNDAFLAAQASQTAEAASVPTSSGATRSRKGKGSN